MAASTRGAEAGSDGNAGRSRGLVSAPLRSKGVITIPRQVREELGLHEGDSLLVTVEDGRIVLTPAALVPRDQAWFWTPEWQVKEHEADEEIAAGGGTVYQNAGEFLSAVRDA
jgi:AbrB family looped-hinge helix DNA binding protein